MTIYAVGDIQGCFNALERLLTKANFDPNTDTLWVAGDLVNRGPESLTTLRFIKALGPKTRVVLGNHDLHLLAVYAGAKKIGKKDTLNEILKAPDCDELLHWLRHQNLMLVEGNWVLSHAGVPHVWSVSQALDYAQEVEQVLRSDDYQSFLHNMYGNEPDTWQPDLTGFARIRLIVNYFTRMRFLRPDGGLNLKAKEGLNTTPEGTQAWFRYPRPKADAGYTFLFGHWAAINGKTFLDNFIALDTGCVWGNKLTMLDLQTGLTQSVPAEEDPPDLGLSLS